MTQELGLDESGETIYQAIITGPGTDAGSLASRTGLPEARVLAALEVLAALGLVRYAGIPGCWEPAGPLPEPAPPAALPASGLDHRHPAITAAYATAAAHGAPLHLERLKDPAAVQAQAQQLISATTTALNIALAPAAAREWHRGSLLTRLGAPAGVMVRALYHESIRDDPVAMAQAAEPAACFQARTTVNLPPVLISDQQAALIPLDHASPGGSALCIREPAIIAILTVMFATAWEAASPLAAAPAASALPGITAHEKTLLRYLLAGLTDEATARRLGVSVRTARRQVAALMGKLGASSRFQAGHEAARRGLL